MDEKTISEAHLTGAELLALAAPATGEPEALPRHVLGCPTCSRRLQEWKASVRALAAEEVDPVSRRTPREWRAAEEATMAAIHRAGRPGRRAHPVRWAVAIAASLLLVALLVPGTRTASTAGRVPRPDAEPAMTAADRADDALLRDAAYLAQGGDTLGDPESDDSL